MVSLQGAVRLGALLCLCVPAHGQTLVADLSSAPYPVDVGSNPGSFATIDGVTYFAATTPAWGRELWRSDGTEAGTQLVADIAPGAAWSDPRDLLALPSGQVLFVASTVAEGRELWVTDGTAAGTHLVADVAPGPESSIGYLPTFEVVDGLAYGFLDDGVHGAEPWVTDGTAAGTSLVVDAFAGPAGHWGFVAGVGTTAYFGSRDVLGQLTLFAKPSGAPAAHFATIENSNEATTYSHEVATIGARFVFSVDTDDEGLELWTSDGTAGGTEILYDAQFAASGDPAWLVEVGGTGFFSLDDLGSGRELWKTDGTPSGTSLVGEVVVGPLPGVMDEPIVPFGSGVVFTAADNAALWFSDGSPPTLFADPPGVSSVDPGVAVGASFVFTAGASGLGLEPWITDGTPGGTQLLGEVAPAHASGWPVFYTPTAGGVLFAAGADFTERELWFSDLTPGGVVQVAELYQEPVNSGSNPRGFTVVGDRMFFVADSDVWGSELFVTDGTTAGTQLVGDTVPGSASGGIGSLAVLGDRVVFQASDGTGTEPWVSDGTVAGTFELLDINPIVTGGVSYGHTQAFGGHAYFSADDGVAGRELWRTDGTTAGTELFADLAPGPGGSNPYGFTAVGDRMYFTTNGEPWVTDGSLAGTFSIGPDLASAGGFQALGDDVVFRATRPDVGAELFVTDGTPGSAQLLADVEPGPDAGVGSSMLVIGGVVAVVKPGFPGELVAVDATGTVTPLTPGSQKVYGTIERLGDDRVVFWQSFSTAFDGPTKLWVSDGTPGGTQFVKALGGTGGAFVQQFRAPGTDARVVFTANDTVHGTELWVTDGTNAGTQRMTDIGPGGYGSTPLHATRLGNRLVFSADDATFGRELWSMPLVSTGAHAAEVMGGGCAGSGGVPSVTTNGAAADGELFTIGLSGAAPNAPSYLAASTQIATLDPCALVPASPLLLLLATDGAGEITVPFVPDGSFVGLRVVLQWATLDPAGSFVNKASLSPALDVVFGP